MVVVFLDVRGFSSFAKLAESSEAALFLRSIYIKILDDYFPSATFFKPTGDGLLIILDYDENNLVDIVNLAVRSSLELVRNFADLTLHDPMVNFDVPNSVGIGLARGAATALISDDHVLDYSGRPLNLAARLMDLARPRGVVFSDTLGHDLLIGEYATQFSSDSVYIKGLAESTPLTVFIAQEMVTLPESSRHPLNRYDRTTTEEKTYPLKRLQVMGDFLHPLPTRPVVTDKIVVHVRFPDATPAGRKRPAIHRTTQYSAEYIEWQGKPHARIRYDEIARKISGRGVKPDWPVTVTIEYSTYADG